jgi:hypothetical protein
MSRPSRVRVLALTTLVAAAGCQDYNFNPVGHCLIQPGTERITLSDISTADVLFVVDESGSMGGEQEKLAQNFQAFIGNLDQTNVARRDAGLDPIDFHLAVTTTSVFLNNPTTASCRSDCSGAPGEHVCCQATNAPFRVVKQCAASADCTTAGTECRTDCNGFLGEGVCCDPSTHVPPRTELLPCETDGVACGDLQRHYRFPTSCRQGNATEGTFYPRGDFIGHAENPRVLHFDKELYLTERPPSLPACSAGTSCNRQGFTADQLKDWFARDAGGGSFEGNVVAGTCGSGQEQALQAARLALEKALSSQQKDSDGSTAEWPHADSKLVLVFVGDEDDCSSPEDATKGVILTGTTGQDSCVQDASLPDGQRKQFAVSEVVDYFAGLGRPLGAAFIASTQAVCEDETCTAGLCCGVDASGAPTCLDAMNQPVCRTDTCGAQGAGFRMLEAASQFRSKGADVVTGSICDPDFDKILIRIAEIVKPPSGLLLPTQPAGSDITLVRIANAKGETRKTCHGPAPATLTAAEADAAGWDWWFTETREQVSAEDRHPWTATRNIYVNHATGNCEANPGETYSADYLGRLPAAGCQSRDGCAEALGGRTADWSCFAGLNADGSFIEPTSTAPGTCVCGEGGGGF